MKAATEEELENEGSLSWELFIERGGPFKEENRSNSTECRKTSINV